MENYGTTLKKHENQLKPKKNHETTLRHFHGWQTGLLRKCSFFVTDKHCIIIYIYHLYEDRLQEDKNGITGKERESQVGDLAQLDSLTARYVQLTLTQVSFNL